MRKLFTGFRQRIVRYFLAGMFAILPLAVTVAIVIWVADFVEKLIGPQTILGRQLSRLGLQFVADARETVSYAIGWAAVLLGVFLLGVLLETGAKNFIQRVFDAVFNRVPVVASIYSTSRQVVDMLDKKDETDLKSMTAVFCRFGREEATYILALLVSPKRFRVDRRECHIVIVPTAPVPFGGGLFFVPVENVQQAGISVDGLMSIYVSMGATAAQFLPEPTA